MRQQLALCVISMPRNNQVAFGAKRTSTRRLSSTTWSKMTHMYGPAAFRKRDCAWVAEVADMYPASHDDFSVNGFLLTAIRGELSHPAGW
jgi:hypothetical protein